MAFVAFMSGILAGLGLVLGHTVGSLRANAADRKPELTHDQIAELSRWLNSRRYDIAHDVMWTPLPVPECVKQMGEEWQIYVALTEIR
jgi:hypothetical protein